MSHPRFAIGLGFLTGALSGREVSRLSSRHHRRRLSEIDRALLDDVVRDAIEIAEGLTLAASADRQVLVWNWRAFAERAPAA